MKGLMTVDDNTTQHRSAVIGHSFLVEREVLHKLYYFTDKFDISFTKMFV